MFDRNDLAKRLRGLCQPGLGDQLFELGHADLPKAHQHCGVAVEMRGGEVHPGLVGDERELDALIGDPGTEDVPVG